MIDPIDIHRLLDYARHELEELRQMEPALVKRWVPILAADVRALHNELKMIDPRPDWSHKVKAA